MISNLVLPKMLSAEVIKRLKAKVPTIKGDHTIYGITQLDVQISDGTIKQFVLLFERLKVDEPTTHLKRNKIYADVLIKITDELLIDIASKEISLDDAIAEKMFKVYGDREIWKLQLNALRDILPSEEFAPRPKKIITIKESENEDDDDDDSIDRIDYGSLPHMDLSNVPEEFKTLTEHFAGLRDKYNTKRVDQ